MLDKDGNEIDLKQDFDDDDDIGMHHMDDGAFENVAVEGDMEGYAVHDAEDEDTGMTDIGEPTEEDTLEEEPETLFDEVDSFDLGKDVFGDEEEF